MTKLIITLNYFFSPKHFSFRERPKTPQKVGAVDARHHPRRRRLFPGPNPIPETEKDETGTSSRPPQTSGPIRTRSRIDAEPAHPEAALLRVRRLRLRSRVGLEERFRFAETSSGRSRRLGSGGRRDFGNGGRSRCGCSGKEEKEDSEKYDR